MGAASRQVDRLVAAIEDDLEHGASLLTAQALGALSAAVAAYHRDPRWAARLEDAAVLLRDAKPSMAGLGNATYRLLARLLEMGPEEGRRRASEVAMVLQAELAAAAEAASVNAAALLADRDVVATCSHSSAVARTLGTARKEGRPVRVLVFEPRRGPQAHGLGLVHELTAGGIDVGLIDGPITPEALAPADAVLLGADAVSPEAVVNGSPGLELALAAQGAVPVYSVCETIKLTRNAVAVPGYDFRPLSFHKRRRDRAREARPSGPGPLDTRVAGHRRWLR